MLKRLSSVIISNPITNWLAFVTGRRAGDNYSAKLEITHKSLTDE